MRGIYKKEGRVSRPGKRKRKVYMKKVITFVEY